MNILINSIITKLQNKSNKVAALIFNSDEAIKKTQELKLKVPNLYIQENAFIVLGCFLQNINLDEFSVQELKLLLSYDFSSINASKILPREFKKEYTPYYDLNNTILNLDYEELNNLNDDFKKIHSINKSLNIEYLITYLISQT
jgi:hypothetical protein